MKIKMKLNTLSGLSFVGISLCVLFWSGVSQAKSPYEMEKGLKVLTRQLLETRKAIGHRMIAIVDFTSLFGDTGFLGRFIAWDMYARLEGKKLRILERSLLREALNDLRLDMTDLVDPEYSKSFGRFTRTDLLLLGTITNLPDTVKINVRLIDIESRIMVGAGSVELRKTTEVFKLMGIPSPGVLRIITTPGSSLVYLDDELLGTTNWMGRLAIHRIDPGIYTLKIHREGYRSITKTLVVQENKELRVEISLEKFPSPGVAATLSFLLPGLGDLYLGLDDWWVYTLGVGATLYGAYYYSKKTEELIWREDDSGRRLEKRGKAPVYAFAGLAAAIWIYDIIRVHSSASEVRSDFEEENRLVLEFNPDSKATVLAYRWNW